MNRSSDGRVGGRGSDRVSVMPAESDVQASTSAIKKNTSVNLNGVMYPRRSTIRCPSTTNNIFTASAMNEMVASGLIPEPALSSSMITPRVRLAHFPIM